MQKEIDNIIPIMNCIIHPDDSIKPWAKSRNNYEWYYTFGKLLQPTSILEVGVSRGYSSVAMGLGCKIPPTQFFLIDSELDGIPITEAIHNIQSIFQNSIIYPLISDSQVIQALPNNFIADISHVDGCHSYEGVQKELSLVYPCTHRYIIVDDTNVDYIAKGVEEFASSHNDIQIIHRITESLTGQINLEKSSPLRTCPTQ